MDAFNIKLEKRNAMLMRRHRQLYKVANLVRFVEFCVVLVLISKFTVQLPAAVKNSCEYFRGFSVDVLVSPRFVFIVGNAIIIALFVKSGQFSSHDSSSSNTSPADNLYEEFIEMSEKRLAIHRCETQYREKQSIINNKKIAGEEKIVSLNNMQIRSKGAKNYRRSKSEMWVNSNNKACQQLRRSESEKYRKGNDSDDQEMVIKSSYPEDGMSNEQFRSTIEAFIARQKKLLREEQYALLKDFE